MALTVHFEVLNQLGTPMMHSATLANRPAAGIAGRIFFRTDSPFGIYRDTGSAWDQISGASTFSGSLATGQVAFGSATDTIAGNNNLFWDAANLRLGIGTNLPTSKLQINGIDSNFASTSLLVNNLAGTNLFIVKNDGTVSAPNGSFFAGALPNGFTISGTGITSTLGNLIQADRCQLRVNNGPVYFYNQGDSGNASTIIMAGKDGANTSFAPVIIGSGTSATLTRETMRVINQTQNVHIGTTFAADTGQRLQVLGDAFIKGTGATSATSALLIQNSAGTAYFRAINDGRLQIGSDAHNTIIFPFSTTDTPSLTSRNLQFYSTNGTQVASEGRFRLNGTAFVQTSGTVINLKSSSFFEPTSGTATFQELNLSPQVSQSGGSNGISRALYVNPILSAAADWRSIEWSNNTGFGLYGAGTAANYLGGSLGIKTTAIYQPSTFSLDVNGGLLIKNTAGTTAQLTLINADPSVGGNNGFLVNTVGGTSGSSYVDLQGYYGTSITGSTALRLNPAGGPVIINSTTNSGEQIQITGTIRVNGQTSGSASGSSGQHLIINCDGVSYKIALLNP